MLRVSLLSRTYSSTLRTKLKILNMPNIIEKYNLIYCLDWILKNQFRRVILQLKHDDLKHSVAIVNYLNNRREEVISKASQPGEEGEPKHIDFYVTHPNTCCVDLLVTQHASNVDAIIHLGEVCLSRPTIKNQQANQPILFSFGLCSLSDDDFSQKLDLIKQEIESAINSNLSGLICLLYDTSLIQYAIELDDFTASECYKGRVHIAKLYSPSQDWHTVPQFRSKFIKEGEKSDAFLFGHFLLPKPITDYYCAIYLGNRRSIQLSLEGPSKLLKIDCHNEAKIESVNSTRLLNRRIALVSRLKDEEELKIGVIVTNPLPDIGDVMERLETYSKPRKHTLYFISMVQTIDDCKIGNFDLCDAFVVINSCTCSTILESLVFNRPIITELEYKLACGFEGEYGRVMWPGSSSHPSADDMINKRKVSDASLALVQLRNELLERCSQTMANKWSGLEFKASVSNIEGGGGGVGGDGCESHESLIIGEGLKGIASSYASEPLKKQAMSSEGKDKGDSCSTNDDTFTGSDNV